MVQVATSDKAPAAARVSAARSLMEHAGLLGTAKEVVETRNNASAEVIDYIGVLDALAKLPAANDDDSPAVQVA
jgi:hypothetical protein